MRVKGRPIKRNKTWWQRLLVKLSRTPQRKKLRTDSREAPY